MRFIIDTMALYVLRDGCEFEQVGGPSSMFRNSRERLIGGGGRGVRASVKCLVVF
jgi:hypothetical protein